MGNIKTKNVKSISVNTKTGHVTVTLNSGKTVTGSVSKSQAAATAAGAVAKFGTSVLHGQAITGQNPTKTSDRTQINAKSKNTYADRATYGEVRAYARTKKGGSPKGLGDVTASIGAVCQRNGTCKVEDGSNSTGEDKQAWKNIVNARGSDKSKGANYMCVNTQHCGFVHQAYTHSHGHVVLEERKYDLEPSVIMAPKHTAGKGGTLTLYFYDDLNKQWLTHKDYIEGNNGGAQQ